MAVNITDDEWDGLFPDHFNTLTLLGAVDAVDALRGDLGDDEGRPPPLRTDLLKLHQLAMAVINHGARRKVVELFDLAADLENQVQGMMRALEQVEDTLVQLTALSPESLAYARLDHDE